MRRFRILSAVLFLGASMGVVAIASAHDASVATIKIVRLPSNAWAFELQTPLHALDRSARRVDEERSRDLGDLPPESTRYKERVVEYVKANFHLETGAADDDGSATSSPTLGAGRIRLDEHVSILFFEIENMPAAFDELTLRLPYMAGDGGQHNILWLVDGDRKERHVLHAGNDFAVLDTGFFGRGS